MSQVVQIERIVDEQRLGWFNVALLGWCFLAMVSDGYEISALASAVPELARSWNIAPTQFKLALSASNFGVLLGAPLLGYIGDRYGRRIAIVAGCVLFGIGTFATLLVTDLPQLVAIRALTGIGIGGLMPNTIALNSELSPPRWRATLVVLMFTGITTGSGAPGLIQSWLVPDYGWRIIFWIGGIAPLVIAAILWKALPESLNFLARRSDRREELLATARRMRPDLAIADNVQFVVAPAPPAEGAGLKQIYSGGLAIITPLLWACFITTLMTNFFLNQWLPTILVQNGWSQQQSGIATSLYHYGGTAGGILISLILARLGFAAIALLFLFAVPAIAAIGFPNESFAMMSAMSAAAGFCVLGVQFGNNALSGLLYPAEVRSRGVGWALGVGRFGSIIGPYFGGYLIGLNLGMQTLFRLVALPMIVGLVAAIALVVLGKRRFGGLHIDDKPTSG